MMKLKLTPEQKAIRSFVRNQPGNAIINSVAGSGKTSTIIEMIEHTEGSLLFLAFNKHIADQIKKRINDKDFEDEVTVKTFHSVGFQALQGRFGRLIVDPDKNRAVEARLNIPKEHRKFTQRLVSLAKNCNLSPSDDSGFIDVIETYSLELEYDVDPMRQQDKLIALLEKGIELSKDCLYEHIELIKNSSLIDFDDMVYGSVYYKCAFPKFDFVMVDEVQDSSIVQDYIVKKLMRKHTGRAVFVGDKNQAVYAFRGADSQSMDRITEKFDCTPLELTASFRCPKKITELARTWVPHIQSWSELGDGQIINMTHDQVFSDPRSHFTKDDVIICRLNKPLIKLAYILFAASVPCHVEGREIGRGLLKLISKFEGSCSRVSDLIESLNKYKFEKTSTLLKAGKDMQAQALTDQIESIEAIAESAVRPDASFWELKEKINQLFRDGGDELTLCTCHKSKGREWDRVHLYGRETYMPSPYAKKEWQKQQERNLIYVAVTRAKQTLIEVSATRTTNRPAPASIFGPATANKCLCACHLQEGNVGAYDCKTQCCCECGQGQYYHAPSNRHACIKRH